MRGKFLIYSSILGTIACAIIACPYNRGRVYYEEITEEEANNFINNFNTEEVVNNLETLYFYHSTISSGIITTTTSNIIFDEDSLYYYEHTLVEYVDGNNVVTMSESEVVLSGYCLTENQFDYATEVGTLTSSSLVDPEYTFSKYANSVLSYLVFNQDILTWLKDSTVEDVYYYKYNDNLRIYSKVEETTANGDFYGDVIACYTPEGLLIDFLYSAQQTIDNNTSYFEEYFYGEHNIVINRT